MMHGILFFPNEVPSSSNNSKTLENDLGGIFTKLDGKDVQAQSFSVLDVLAVVVNTEICLTVRTKKDPHPEPYS